MFAASAPAQSNPTASIAGVYNGSYAGGQDAPVRGEVANASVRPITPVKFKLAITQHDNGILAGEFTLYLPEGSGTKAYTCALTGYVHANGTFLLNRGKWETPPPAGFEMAAGMNGLFDPNGGNGAGQISGKIRDGSWPKFEAVRDAAESARMAAVNADKPDGAGAAGQPGRAAGAQPAATKSAAASVVTWRTAINGVYTGTYGSNPDDKVPAKLYVKFIEDGSVNGTLSGLFTFDVPPSAGAKPITYTYKLIGVTEPGNGSGFQSAKPLGKPAPDAYAMTQLWVYFVRSLVKGSNGQVESSFNPDQITGRVFGSKGLPSNTFEAVRDKAESAQVESLMAARASAAIAAGSVVSTTAPAQSPSSASSPASAASTESESTMAAVGAPRMSPPVGADVRPSLQGVFNGTYTRENEAPTKFKLTITQTREGLAGVATIYLPTDSGTKAYTYSLKGAQVPYAPRDFNLTVQDWDTIPPKDFKDFKAMGFNGTFLSNMNQNTGRIISVPASGSLATFCVPKFEAAWDATESGDIKGTIAAQEAVGNTDQEAALKAHAEAVKNAPPKQLASKNLVRKSKAYWDGYGSDFIREVFDGGFASDVDNDPDFQLMFIDYVDLFSKNCAAYLPADHKTVTITTVTTTTYPGGAVDTKTTSKTVEIDSRFIPKYAEYSGVDPAPGSEQEKEQTAKTIAIAGQIFHAGGPSHGTSPADANAMLHLMAAHGLAGGGGMDKFFAAEVKASGPSAALRQMGENLLRGATGEPSLQEAGGKIEGAQAESDKDLPPGRFARLIDAAHAFYRDPANARLEGRFETAFDETLAAKYRGVMTPEEEYYYANDYESRFFGQIMQPRTYCKDPEWPRLHPAVEECVKELGQ